VLWILWSSDRTRDRKLFASRSADGERGRSAPLQISDGPWEDDFPQVLTAGSERLLVWARYRHGSPLRSFYRDGSAERSSPPVSRDGLDWTEPMPCSPLDPHNRYVDILPVLFADLQGIRFG
jgi:hypothetical protein